jgi:hypothetical protein
LYGDKQQFGVDGAIEAIDPGTDFDPDAEPDGFQQGFLQYKEGSKGPLMNDDP